MGRFPYPEPLQHRAELFQTEPEELRNTLGVFRSAPEARTACGLHAWSSLIWIQPWEGLWGANGEDDTAYRVTALLD